MERTAPTEVHEIDPSDRQLSYARMRIAAGMAEFRRGDAMALPFPAAKGTGAGLVDLETRRIEVQRGFVDVDDFRGSAIRGSTIAPTLASMAPQDIGRLKSRVQAQLPTAAGGGITHDARANAIKGRVPNGAPLGAARKCLGSSGT